MDKAPPDPRISHLSSFACIWVIYELLVFIDALVVQAIERRIIGRRINEGCGTVDPSDSVV